MEVLDNCLEGSLPPRGQVLPELGRYTEAIEELTDAFTFSRSALSNAYLHSARAFAIGMTGDLDTALQEFSIAEAVVSDSGWLYFWRALCLKQHGLDNESRVGLVRALKANAAPLNRTKREKAIELLGAWESK